MESDKALPEPAGHWQWKITPQGHIVVKSNDNKHLFEAKKQLEALKYDCTNADIYVDTDKLTTMCLRGAA